MTQRSLIEVVSVLGCLSLAGCTSSTMEGDGDHADTGDAIAAVSGSFVTHVTWTKDTCGQAREFNAEVVDVAAAADGSEFHYMADGIGYTCERAGKSADYQCVLQFGAPVVATTDFPITWKSSTRFEGDLQFTFDCDKPGSMLCEQLKKAFPGGLPCETAGHYTATKALPKSFAPAAGDYKIKIGQPTMNTCATAVEQRPEASIALAGQSGGFTLQGEGDDEPISCASAAGGSANCFRELEGVDGPISHTLEGGWTSETLFEGALTLEFGCADGKTTCPATAQTGLGTLPCRTVYPVSLTPAAAAGAN